MIGVVTVRATPRGEGSKPGLFHARRVGYPKTLCGRAILSTWDSESEPVANDLINVECRTCVRTLMHPDPSTAFAGKLDMQPEDELTERERAVIGQLYVSWGKQYMLVGFRKDDGPWMVEMTGQELPRTVSVRAIGRTFHPLRRMP